MLNTIIQQDKLSKSQQHLTYKELDILHALRGFCALYVVVFHAKFVLWSGGTEYLRIFPRVGWHVGQYLNFIADMASSAGYDMVIFFFVLSGFFIRYAQQKKHRPALKFYVNRIARIYPPFLVSMLLAIAVLAGIGHYGPELLRPSIGRELNTGLFNAWYEFQSNKLRSIGRGIVFLKPGHQYFGHNQVYWSLLQEALFYLLVPLAFRRIRSYYSISVLLFIVGTGVALKGVPVGEFLSFLLVFNGYFALGSWLYDFVISRPKAFGVIRRINGLALTVMMALLSGSVIVLAALQLHILAGPLAALLAVLSVLVLLAGRVRRENIIIKVFHKVGLFSFSLYLYHYPLLLLSYLMLAKITGTTVIYDHWYWLFVPLIVGSCYALYYVTERRAVEYFRGV